MRCPSCGFQIDQANPDRCPQCGRILAPTPAPALQAPEAPEVAPYEPHVTQASPDTAPAPGSTSAADSSSAAPPSAPPPQPTPPSYNPYPPAAPYPPYPPYPPAPGPYAGPPNPYGPYTPYGPPPAAPGYAPYAPYAPPGYPQLAQGPAPASARKKPRTGLIVAIVAVVVVVLAACGWGVVATVQALRPPTLSPIPRETPTEIYSNDFSSNAADWANDANCFLSNDGYHINDAYICYAPIGNYSDIDVKVQVKQISGPIDSSMGIAFRLLADNGTITQFYLFGITANGRWGFEKCSKDSCARLVNYHTDSAINKGLGEVNTLEVYAKGSRMDMFVNGKLVGSLEDADFSTGMIGLASGEGTECVFTNLFIGELD